MINVLLWGCGYIYNTMKNTISYYECANIICIKAIVSSDDFIKEIDGYPVIQPRDIYNYEYSLIIVMSDKNFDSIVMEAKNIYKLKRDLIIPYRVLQIPNLDLEKYLQIKNKNVSIVSNNCWGGVVYHTLGLECTSPFKNLFLLDDDYLKCIQKFDFYMEQRPTFERTEIDLHSRKEYPVLRLYDIELHCNHDTNYEIAIDNWLRRREKINFEELFFEMYTTKPQNAEKFVDMISGKKGVCYVPFDSNNSQMLFLKMPNKHKEFWETVNANASLELYEYSLVDLLLGERKDRFCK